MVQLLNTAWIWMQVRRSDREVRRLTACWLTTGPTGVAAPGRHRASFRRPRLRPSKWPSSLLSVTVFTARRYASAVYVSLCVRPSVCMSHAGIVPKWLKCRITQTTSYDSPETPKTIFHNRLKLIFFYLNHQLSTESTVVNIVTNIFNGFNLQSINYFITTIVPVLLM